MNSEQLDTLIIENSTGTRCVSHYLFALEELPIAENEND